jgi:hypothetical protein
MRIQILSFIVVASALALDGCGGSSGVSAGYPTAPSTGAGNPVGPGVNGGSQLAKWVVGNTWNYSVSGTLTEDYLDEANQKATIGGTLTSGTLVREVSAAPAPFASGVFQVTDTFTFAVGGSQPQVQVSTRYFLQGSDGSLTQVGMGNTFIQTMFTSGASASVPGTFSGNANLSSSASGGSFYPGPSAGTTGLTDAFTSLGQVSVPSSKGVPYTAWKTQDTQTATWEQDYQYITSSGNVIPIGWPINSSYTKTETDYWVPSIGAPVEFKEALNGEANVILTYTINTSGFTYTSTVLNSTANLEYVLTSRS